MAGWYGLDFNEIFRKTSRVNNHTVEYSLILVFCKRLE